MKNLAGVKECDVDIRRELTEAGIKINHVKKGKTEVPYTLIGRLGQFDFRRAWYYWTVSGKVPIEVARELYANSVGKKIFVLQEIAVARRQKNGLIGMIAKIDYLFPWIENPRKTLVMRNMS